MELTAVAPQTVAPGANIQFTEIPVWGNGSSIITRPGSGLIQLRGNTCQCRARYLVQFSGNISVADGGTVGPIQVSLTLDGEPVASTTRIVTPAAIGDLFAVAAEIYIDVPKGCCMTAAVRNTSADTAITSANFELIATRVA